MKTALRPLQVGLVLAVAVLCGSVAVGDDLPWVQVQGSRFVDPQGEKVTLRGCNAGNWFLIEMWMLAIDHAQFADQYDFEANLARRFGEAEKDRLMDVYRANWITPRDFATIRSFGFNVVRLPFNYRLLEDDARPGVVKEAGFVWLDRAIEMAEAEGLYVILDMHGVPGGQSVDHPTGRVDQNKLWGDPVYGRRTAALWGKIADRYRDRSSIAGYDVINEPYGDFSMDVRPRLREIFEEIYLAIREVDERHVIFAPSPIWGGLGFYGNPHENGWTQVAFTEHHYPGLFGSDPSLRTHGNFVYREFPKKQAELEAVQTAMFIGEWNPVFELLGGGDLMRLYFDEYEKLGWAATIWSYKILHPEGGVIDDNWYMVSNAEPLTRIDFEVASKREIEGFFEWLGTMAYVVDEPMRRALTRSDPIDLDLPRPPPPLAEAPRHDDLPGWTATDIGDPIPGGQRRLGDGEFVVYGGGEDIWRESDSFRFVSREVAGDFVLTATVAGLRDTHDFAKAGLMIRADLSPGSAHALAHTIPGGRLVFGIREESGATMSEQTIEGRVSPVRLRLTRRGDTIRAEYASAEGGAGDWEALAAPLVAPALADRCRVGFAVVSHQAKGLTEARFTDVHLEVAR